MSRKKKKDQDSVGVSDTAELEVVTPEDEQPEVEEAAPAEEAPVEESAPAEEPEAPAEDPVPAEDPAPTTAAAPEPRFATLVNRKDVAVWVKTGGGKDGVRLNPRATCQIRAADITEEARALEKRGDILIRY